MLIYLQNMFFILGIMFYAELNFIIIINKIITFMTVCAIGLFIFIYLLIKWIKNE